MPEQYFAACPSCEARLLVQLTDAGTQRSCGECKTTFTVPNSLKLKELSGDPYPSLRPIDKVRKSLVDKAPPFDGLCHGCSQKTAEFVVPVTFSIMEERTMSGDGGVWVTPWFVAAHSPGGIEHWSGAMLPLFLCESCLRRFQRERNWSRLRSVAKILLAGCGIGVFVWLASKNLELVAAYAKPVAFFAMIIAVLSMRIRGRRRRVFVEGWLRRIQWVGEAIDAEDEYHLHVGKSQSLRKLD